MLNHHRTCRQQDVTHLNLPRGVQSLELTGKFVYPSQSSVQSSKINSMGIGQSLCTQSPQKESPEDGEVSEVYSQLSSYLEKTLKPPPSRPAHWRKRLEIWVMPRSLVTMQSIVELQMRKRCCNMQELLLIVLLHTPMVVREPFLLEGASLTSQMLLPRSMG